VFGCIRGAPQKGKYDPQLIVIILPDQASNVLIVEEGDEMGEIAVVGRLLGIIN
jgi:hypothetical protein